MKNFPKEIRIANYNPQRRLPSPSFSIFQCHLMSMLDNAVATLTLPLLKR